jgi:hypothetical protein
MLVAVEAVQTLAQVALVAQVAVEVLLVVQVVAVQVVPTLVAVELHPIEVTHPIAVALVVRELLYLNMQILKQSRSELVLQDQQPRLQVDLRLQQLLLAQEM